MELQLNKLIRQKNFYAFRLLWRAATPEKNCLLSLIKLNFMDQIQSNCTICVNNWFSLWLLCHVHCATQHAKAKHTLNAFKSTSNSKVEPFIVAPLFVEFFFFKNDFEVSKFVHYLLISSFSGINENEIASPLSCNYDFSYECEVCSHPVQLFLLLNCFKLLM